MTRTELGSHEAGGSSGEDECVGIFKENGGVAKIVVLDDRYVWTATSSSSVNRWVSYYLTDGFNVRQVIDIVFFFAFFVIQLSIPPKHSRGLLSRSAYNPEIPNSAMVQLPPPDIAFSGPLPESFMSSENMTLYAGSVLSIPMSYQEDDAESSETLVPLRDTPESVIEGNYRLNGWLQVCLNIFMT